MKKFEKAADHILGDGDFVENGLVIAEEKKHPHVVLTSGANLESLTAPLAETFDMSEKDILNNLS